MKILSVDPSYSNFAVNLFDTDNKEILLSHNIKFSSLSSLKKIEKEQFLNIDYNNLTDKEKSYYKEIWDNIRLNYFVTFIKEVYVNYGYDVVVTESQFVQTMSDVFASVRLASVVNNKALPFYSYKSKSWNKILFNDGGMDSKKAKEITRNKLKELGYDFGSCQDLYDSFAILLSYIKSEHKDIFDNDFWNKLRVK